MSNNWLEDCTLVVNAYQALRKRPTRGDPIAAEETNGGVTVGQFGLSVDVYTLGIFYRSTRILPQAVPWRCGTAGEFVALFVFYLPFFYCH